MSKKIEVSDSTTGYGYFTIHQRGGRYVVYQCSVHWANGWSPKRKVGEARSQSDAMDLIKSFSGGRTLIFR
jgi:hypothetical protein